METSPSSHTKSYRHYIKLAHPHSYICPFNRGLLASFDIGVEVELKGKLYRLPPKEHPDELECRKMTLWWHAANLATKAWLLPKSLRAQYVTEIGVPKSFGLEEWEREVAVVLALQTIEGQPTRRIGEQKYVELMEVQNKLAYRLESWREEWMMNLASSADMPRELDEIAA